MDDMLFQSANQHSVYVLDANYNSYQEFTPFNQIETSRVRSIDASSCSNISCNFQHKLKSLGNCASVSASASANVNGLARPTITSESSGCGNPIATSMSAAMCSPATTALQKLFNCSSSSSSSNLSCNNGGGSNNTSACRHASQNVSHRSQNNFASYYDNYSNSNNSHSSSIATSNHNNNNNCNNSSNSNNSSCLSTSTHNGLPTTERDKLRDAGALFGARVALNVGSGSAGANKKKCANVKSTLIAKKTKFLKFLEEEKWRRNDDNSCENIYSSANSQQQHKQHEQQQERDSNGSSSVGGNGIRASKSNNAATASFAGNSSVQHSTLNALAKRGDWQNNKNHEDGQGDDDNDDDGVCVGKAGNGVLRQNKLNNWSVNNDSNNQDQRIKQQQQQQPQQQNKQTKFKQTQKSSYELYKEAADLLGLSCTLCDNCRCLDCQSGYFDCDDSDSSDQSFMDDEYGDDGENIILVNGQMTNMAMLMSMHANANEVNDSVVDCYACADNWQAYENDNVEELNCDDCNAAIRHDDDEAEEEDGRKITQELLHNEETSTSTHNQQHQQPQRPQHQQHHDYVAALTDACYNDDCEHDASTGDDAGTPATLITAATCSKIVENCENFNDLSLLDAGRKVKTPQGMLAKKEAYPSAFEAAAIN